MKRTLLSSLFLAASIMVAPAAQAAGILVIDPVGGAMPIMPPHPLPITPRPIPGHPTPRPIPRPGIILKGQVSYGLRMQAADIKVDINDQVARTYITQTFVNDTDRNLAGTYLFPLPEDTTFSSFSLHIDGKPVEGKILEANEARAQYEEIVRRMVDPGLLEYADYRTVRARIFPIPAHGTKKVELEYTQVLKAENGMLKYRFPLKTENDTSPADSLKVNVKLSSKQGLRTIWSPSHTIAVNKSDDHSAKIAYLERDAVPDKDFLLYYSVSDKDLAANLLTHKSVNEDGYYMLTITPPVEAKAIVNKDIVLVVDTSGSMQGDRIEQNKKALKYLINALNPGDRFNIVQFNTDVDNFKDSMVTANAESKKAAMAYIDDLEARGGTNLGDALRNAMTLLGSSSERPGYLVLMTDGEPTVGETSADSILKLVNGKRDVRVFDFGVGYDINTRLLNKLAEAHHGTAQYIEPDESMETALANFYQKIRTPVLSNIKIAYDGMQVKDVYPRDVKDIFAGSQVLLIGKYKGSGNSTVRLTGTVNGVQKAYSFPASFAGEQSGNTYLPRLWAMRRIGHLTEVAQENGNSKEVVDEIIALSKKYGIISQYTSFLVTDPNEQNAHGMPVGVATPMAGMVRRDRAVASSFAAAGGGGGMAVDSMAMGAPTAMRVEGRLQRKAAITRQALPSAAPMPPMAGDKAAWFSSAREAQIVDDRPMITDYRDLVSNAVSGKEAVRREKTLAKMKDGGELALKKQDAGVKSVEEKTFFFRNGYWTDSAYDGRMKLDNITFGSKEYFDLLKSAPGISKYLSVGRQVILIFNGHGYKVSFTQTT